MKKVVCFVVLATALIARGDVLVLSNAIQMWVYDPPVVITQPVSQVKTVGQSVTFTCDGTGDMPLTWKWQFNSVDIVGATLSSYTIGSVQLTNAGGHRCRVTSAKGVPANSDTATLTVYHLLYINIQPTDHPNVVAGTTVVFSVEADGEGALSYQWAKGGTLPANYIAGATMQAYAISNVQTTDNGNYACIVSDSRPTDGGGPQSLASTAALLNVVASVANPELVYAHPAGGHTMTGMFNAHSRTLPEMLASPGALPSGKTLSDVTGLEIVFKVGTDEYIVRYTIAIPVDGNSSTITVSGADAVDWEGESHPFELAGFTGQTRMSFMINTASYGAKNDVVGQFMIQNGAPKTELQVNGTWRDISTP